MKEVIVSNFDQNHEPFQEQLKDFLGKSFWSVIDDTLRTYARFSEI